MTVQRTHRRTSREQDDFFAELERPSKRFLTDEEKQQLADEAIPFAVNESEFTESKQYGGRWEMLIVPLIGNKFPFDIEGTPRVILTLPSHGARDHIMRKLERALQDGPVFPLLLTSTDIEDGKTWYALKKAEA